VTTPVKYAATQTAYLPIPASRHSTNHSPDLRYPLHPPRTFSHTILNSPQGPQHCNPGTTAVAAAEGARRLRRAATTPGHAARPILTARRTSRITTGGPIRVSRCGE
jgi:hypothetical protein